ncbi:MAG: hypothetical protein ACOYN8_15920 [Pseudanabaena sp.]
MIQFYTNRCQTRFTFDRRSGLPPLSDRTTTENVICPAGREIIVIRG